MYPELQKFRIVTHLHDISILDSNLDNSVPNSQESEISAVEPIRRKSAKKLPKKSSFDLPKFSNLERPKMSENVKHSEQQKKNDATAKNCRILV